LSSIIKYIKHTKEKNKMGGTFSTYGERRGVYRISVGKLERKRKLGRHRRKLEDDIKIDLQEVKFWAWTGLS
jgi:hypothetical protein